ncbi:MAG: antibiotic acetyltransferase [Opitutaceae bacterium]|nr:antibiotic acetyltransferase [Cytophagales bacterium]
MKQLIRYVIQRFRFPHSSISFSSLITSSCIINGKAIIDSGGKLIDSEVGSNYNQGKETICVSIKSGISCRISEQSVITSSKLGSFVSIGQRSVMHQCTIGNHSYFAQEVLAYHVSIGNFCSIGPRVIFGHGDHPANRLSTSPEFYTQASASGHSFVSNNSFEEFAPITIGHDVWIGANAYIKHGVTIGNGAIVAAGAVVNKDVEPYCIMGGVPAKKIKERFSTEIIAMLLQLKWWDWSDDKIKKNSFLFENVPENLLFSKIENILNEKT